MNEDGDGLSCERLELRRPLDSEVALLKRLRANMQRKAAAQSGTS